VECALGTPVELGFRMSSGMATTEGVPEEGDVVSLVAAARGGDRGAFGRLYERYARMVHGILLGRVPVGEVEDLVQDVFVRAMRQVHTLRDVNAFGGWLATVARNRANDFHRRSVETVEFTEEASNQATEKPRSTGAGDDGAAILGIIRGLPEAYRETLILRLVEGMTGPEIAERTELTAGSVRVNLHRGMQMLREKLGTRA
jgi:RNA polymerase sigma-70 factor, ECF subfamily